MSKGSTYISEPSEGELLGHARNIGSTHIGPVHQGHTVHGTNGDDEATVNATNNALLFLLGEAKVLAEARVGAQFAIVIDVVHLGPLLFQLIVCARFDWSRHGGRICVGLRLKMVLFGSWQSTLSEVQGRCRWKRELENLVNASGKSKEQNQEEGGALDITLVTWWYGCPPSGEYCASSP